MASRKDMWMLASTVRSSSFASIMRTGTSATARPRCAAASACSSSVWPGYWSYGAPAAASASLCKGAVTMAATSPRNAARAAHVTQSPAMRPACALTCPSGTSACAGTTCSTGMQPGGAVNAWAGVSISATGRPTCTSGG